MAFPITNAYFNMDMCTSYGQTTSSTLHVILIGHSQSSHVVTQKERVRA